VLAKPNAVPGQSVHGGPKTKHVIPPWTALAVAGLTLAAFGLRIFHLDATGLWADELATVQFATMPLGPLLSALAAHEPHPPFYYLLIKVLQRALQDNDLIIRLPSAVASTMIVPATFGLARRIVGSIPGLVAAGLVALSPFLVWYGQEARVYAILALFSVIATYRLWIALTNNSVRAWALYALALALTIETHYFAMAVVGLHGVAILAWPMSRREKRRGVLALAAGVATFVPWLIYARHLSTRGWMQPVTLGEAVRRTLWAYSVGTSVTPEQGWLFSAPLIVASVLGVFWLVTARDQSARLGGLLLAGSTLAPLALSCGLGIVTHNGTYIERYVIGGTPTYLALAAIGVAGLLVAPWRVAWPSAASGLSSLKTPARTARLIPFAMMVAGSALLIAIVGADGISLKQHYFDVHFSKEDLRGAANYIDARAAPSDLVIGAPARVELFHRYTRLSMPTLISPANWDEARLNRQVADSGGTRQIWLLPASDASDAVLKSWLDAHAYRLDGRWFGIAPMLSWFEDTDPSMTPTQISFDSTKYPILSVSRTGLGVSTYAGERIIKLAFEWRALRKAEQLTLAMRLVDSRGRIVAEVDRPFSSLSDSWTPGDGNQIERSALRAPADLPGGQYFLRVATSDTAGSLIVRSQNGASSEWTVGEITLPKPVSVNPGLVKATRIDNATVGTDLRLIGHEPVPPVPAGGRTTVVLHWQAIAPNAFSPGVLGATRVGLRNSSGGAPPEAATLAGAPTRAEGLLRDAREIRVPSSTPPGTYDLVLWGISPTRPQITLGTIQVTPDVAHRLLATPTHPMNAQLGPISLLGYDLSGEPTANGRLVVRLYWKANSDVNEDLSVFVHVAFSNEQILAQHDGRPCGGKCPTEDWSAGDSFIDEHTIQLPSNAPPGTYRLLVGIYNPRTGKRLTRVDPAPANLSDRILLGEITISN